MCDWTEGGRRFEQVVRHDGWWRDGVHDVVASSAAERASLQYIAHYAGVRDGRYLRDNKCTR